MPLKTSEKSMEMAPSPAFPPMRSAKDFIEIDQFTPWRPIGVGLMRRGRLPRASNPRQTAVRRNPGFRLRPNRIEQTARHSPPFGTSTDDMRGRVQGKPRTRSGRNAGAAETCIDAGFRSSQFASASIVLRLQKPP